MAVDEALAKPFMPHVSLSRTYWVRLYPSVTVPTAVGADAATTSRTLLCRKALGGASQRPGTGVCRAGAQAVVGQ